MTTVEIIGETSVKRKKGENIDVKYLGMNEAGEVAEFKIAPDNVIGVRVRTTDGVINEDVLYADMAESIRLQGWAFGMNTVLRNQYNTALASSDSKDDAAVSLIDRLEGIRKGVWRSSGEGEGGEPLAFAGLLRAFKEAGREADGQAKYEEYSKAYAEADKKGREDIRKKLEASPKIKEAMLKIQAERTAERLQKHLANQPQTADDGLGSL